MAYKPSARRDRTKRVTVTFDGEELWVEYRPASITGEMYDSIAELKRSYQQDARWVERVITAWEVVDEDGNIVKPSYEAAMTYEPAFLAAVITGVVDDMRPNPQNGSGSFGG